MGLGLRLGVAPAFEADRLTLALALTLTLTRTLALTLARCSPVPLGRA